MLESIFFYICEITISVSVIILIIAWSTTYTTKKYNIRWRKTIWLLLAIRLLIPYNFTLPENLVFKLNISGAFDDNGIIIPIAVILSAVWLTGAILIWRIQYLGFKQFKKEVMQNSKELKGGDIYKLFEKIRIKMNVHKIPLYYCNIINTPMVMGVFEKYMLLPEAEYDKEDLQNIFVHEFTHIQKKDSTYKYVLMIIEGIHWFNPLVHLMVRLSYQDVELVCDQYVTKEMNIEQRAKYSMTILDSISKENKRSLATTTCFYGSKKLLKKRIENVFDMKKKKKGIGLILILFIIFIILNLFISCGYKKNEISEVNASETKDKIQKEPISTNSSKPIFYVYANSFKGLYINKEEFNIINFYTKEMADGKFKYYIKDGSLFCDEYTEVGQNAEGLYISKWINGTKIADQVVYVDYNYFDSESGFYLTKDGILHGIGKLKNIEISDAVYARNYANQSIILKKDGSVWCLGTSYSSDDAGTLTYPVPTQVLSDAKYVVIGQNNYMAITTDGSLYMWGDNSQGQFGDGSLLKESSDMFDSKQSFYNEPVKVADNILMVWAGAICKEYAIDFNYARTFMETNDQNIYVCGEEIGENYKQFNSYGEGNEMLKIRCTSELFPVEVRLQTYNFMTLNNSNYPKNDYKTLIYQNKFLMNMVRKADTNSYETGLKNAYEIFNILSGLEAEEKTDIASDGAIVLNTPLTMYNIDLTMQKLQGDDLAIKYLQDICCGNYDNIRMAQDYFRRMLVNNLYVDNGLPASAFATNRGISQAAIKNSIEILGNQVRE